MNSKKPSLLETHKLVCEDWDYSKNQSISPDQVTYGSHKMVWWKCKTCGYEWESTVKDRTSRGCPVCAGKKVLSGFNDIATTDPYILEEWDYEKNTIHPTEITRGSGKKVYWKCKNCHGVWEESVCLRVISNYGCPYCNGKRVLVGYNDLESKIPSIINEWDYERNDLLPNQVTVKSMKKVWWICPTCGNSYEKRVCDKTKGSGCPKCAKESQSSFPEQTIFYYVSKLCNDAINGYTPKWLRGKELDIYIPSLKIGIEYDGSYYHQSPSKDIKKDELVSNQGIKLIRLREHDCPALDSTSFCIILDKPSSQFHHLESGIALLLKAINNSTQKIDINIERDRFDIINSYILKEKAKSLVSLYPELATEWNFEKNNSLEPSKVSAGSRLKVWWKCKVCNYEWQAVIKDRVSGSGCPLCSNQVIVEGKNDLSTLKPYVASEWNYEKNGDLKPTSVGIWDNRIVWWKCSKCGKEWQSRISKRNKAQCPTCNYSEVAKKRHLVVGKNDLSSSFPNLLKEWDYEKNAINPTEITGGSHAKVWWICSKCGHHWQSMVCDRTSNHGCPECSKKEIGHKKQTPKKGESFLDLYPSIAAEWHPKKNGNLKPSDFKPKSHKVVWWICSKCGREWETSILNRTSGHGCRHCAHLKK